MMPPLLRSLTRRPNAPLRHRLPGVALTALALLIGTAAAPVAPRAPDRALAAQSARGATPASPEGVRPLPRVRPETVGASARRLERVDGVLDGFVERGEVAGAVALVVREGRTVAFDSAGVMDAGSGRPMQGDALFRIASMTKPVTSVAALILVEEGRLALADPVSEYIPAFSDMTVAVVEGEGDDAEVREVPARRPVTIHHLLTHRSGLTYGFLEDGPVGEMYREAGVSDGIGPTDLSLAENVERLAAQPLVHQPGEAWQYGLSTDVLGRVVEVASGRSLADFLRTRIFEPLGMDDTHFAVPRGDVSRVAALHRIPDDGPPRPLERSVITRTEYFSGGAGLYSTARDYARFLQMLLNGGVLAGDRILAPRTVELMTRSHTEDLAESAFAEGSDFGLGFAVLEDPGVSGTMESVGTYSWGGIFGTTFWVDPAERIVGVGMIQLSPDTAEGFGTALRTAVYQALLEPSTTPAPRP